MKLLTKPGQNSSATHFWAATHQLRNAALEGQTVVVLTTHQRR